MGLDEDLRPRRKLGGNLKAAGRFRSEWLEQGRDSDAFDRMVARLVSKNVPGKRFTLSIGDSKVAAWSDRSGPGGLVRLSFEDGSYISAATNQDEVTALDVGVALLEPITSLEYGGIEKVLDVLWKAIDDGDLEDHHLLQLRTMYDLLFDDHRGTEVDVSLRHKLVGTMRAVALLSNRDGIRAGLAWWKIAEILVGIRWDTVARILPGGPA